MKNGPRVLLLVSFLLLFLSPHSGARAPAQGPIVKKVLSNGATLILQQNPAAPVVSIQAWVRTGSASEQPHEYGMAHFLEHLLFKGTAKRGVGEIAREVEAAGGEINAYTSWDTTVYFISIASRFTDKAVDILSDLVQAAALDEDELAREKDVVLEEIRRGEDLPQSKFRDAFFQKAYPSHPYGRPVIGFADTVTRFSRDDVLAYYRNWYAPGNTVWVIAGDLDPGELLPQLEMRLGATPARELPVPQKSLEPAQNAPRSFVLKQDVAEAHLKLGFPIPGIAHPDVPALDLLAQVLGQGRSSRLYQAFRMNRRLVNSIHAYSLTPADPGLFTVSASLEIEAMEQALEGILEEVFRIAREPVTEEELRTARVQIESDFIYGKQTVQGQARELGYYEAVIGDINFSERYLERIRSLRPADLVRVARATLDPRRITIGVLVPAGENSPVNEEGLLRKVEQAGRALGPRVDRGPEHSADSREKVYTSRLANGAWLLVKENHAVPLVSCQAFFLGGVLSETPETNGISNFTARMLTKGTASRSAEQIAREIEALAGSVSGFSGKNALGLSADVVSWNFQPALEIFSDLLLHPEFPEDQMEKTRQDILAEIKNQEDRPASLAFLLFWKNLFPCHPYGMDKLGSPETVRGVRRKDLRSYYRRTAVGPNLALAVVGDVDAQEVRQRVELFLGKLRDKPYEPAEPGKPRCAAPAVREETRLVSPDKQQAHILIGARGARFTDRERYRLSVLAAVLAGQGGRLFVELRDRLSLAYSVTALSQEAYDPGAFMLYIATKPENLSRAEQGLLEELRKIREGGVSEEELERAKNYLVGTYDLSIQTNAAQASILASSERYGVGHEEYWLYPDRIRAVTAEEVREAAQKTLSPECLIRTVVTPGENAAGALTDDARQTQATGSGVSSKE